MELESRKFGPEIDMKADLALQSKLSEMMCNGDLELWIRKYAELFRELMSEKPKPGEQPLPQRVHEEITDYWSAANNKESPLVRWIADELQSRDNLTKEAEPDEDVLQRAA